MASSDPEEIVDELTLLVDRQNLTERAAKAMVAYWREADPDDIDWAFTLEELTPELGAQMLCFRSSPTNVRAPYVATHLRLHVYGYEVGWYELLTTLAGETIREDGAILEDFYAGGRASALIGRARERPAGERQEWIGLVGLKAMPGNTFFPEEEAGGFTTTLALARDENDYRRRVEEFFADKGVEVEEVDDVEPLTERLRTDPAIDDEALELAAALSDSSPVVHMSTIYAYSTEEGEDEEG